MSETKMDKSLPFTYNFASAHPMSVSKEMANNIGNFLSIKDVSRVMRTMKNNHIFYGPILDKKQKVEEAQTYVVRGDVKSLIKLIQENLKLLPFLIFEKHEKINAPRGQIYYDMSTFQLMTFLCEKDMKVKTMSVIPNDKVFNDLRQAQYAEIDCGGADLVKVDRDPNEIIFEHGFEGLTQYKTTYTLFDGSQPEVTHPLLENPDGIFCFQKQLFYVNQEEKIIELLDYIIPEESELAFEQLIASFDAMENNSGRRSSESEHQLIARVLQISLVRKGILYQDNGIFYRDSRTPFKIEAAYRKYIRLYEEANNDNFATADESWREDVGKAQGEEIWLLQRICEENKPFYLLNPKSFDDFNRGKCVVYNYETGKNESCFDNGVINISGVALFKDLARRAGACGARRGGCVALDLVAINWLIEDAKASVIELKPEQEVQMNCTIR